MEKVFHYLIAQLKMKLDSDRVWFLCVFMVKHFIPFTPTKLMHKGVSSKLKLKLKHGWQESGKNSNFQ